MGLGVLEMTTRKKLIDLQLSLEIFDKRNYWAWKIKSFLTLNIVHLFYRESTLPTLYFFINRVNTGGVINNRWWIYLLKTQFTSSSIHSKSTLAKLHPLNLPYWQNNLDRNYHFEFDLLISLAGGRQIFIIFVVWYHK